MGLGLVFRWRDYVKGSEGILWGSYVGLCGIISIYSTPILGLRGWSFPEARPKRAGVVGFLGYLAFIGFRGLGKGAYGFRTTNYEPPYMGSCRDPVW